ncbi:hypothetical protein BE20_10665 [Sorangium cellulosum]|uniref:Uncharacterized protein n=1 Tax=Sorangium cellulosum TaxID=56 RepID=A0A150SL19_SORCE|nr:hypothetical protein BE18_21390 [Sorangium cellulosum]KYF92908.1 hypothetical protein BE20_10665 [Sorangium cellulosum]
MILMSSAYRFSPDEPLFSASVGGVLGRSAAFLLRALAVELLRALTGEALCLPAIILLLPLAGTSTLVFTSYHLVSGREAPPSPAASLRA